MNKTCNYKSSWTDSGDRGADMAEHERSHHPDHKHVWGRSPYDWEQEGTFHMVTDPDNWPRAIRLPRQVAEIRCQVCALHVKDNREGRCG